MPAKSHPSPPMTREPAERIAGQMYALAGIAQPSSDGWTYLNNDARALILGAAAMLDPQNPQSALVSARADGKRAGLEKAAKKCVEIDPDPRETADWRTGFVTGLQCAAALIRSQP